jgi:catechol 2,3-dioxygenase-like lactoylglutathione lyase family enzyme
MAVDALQHINIHTADAEQSRDFYVRVIGLRVGDRPPLTSAGYWLYVRDQPVIHLIQIGAEERPQTGSGAIDHVAFRGIDIDKTRQALATAGVPYREVVVPRDKTVQLFVHDPNGVRIELNFDPPNA